MKKKKVKKLTKKEEIKLFWETLRKCEEEVKTWLAWKRNIKLSHEGC